MPLTTAAPVIWAEVMAGFTGQRLAIHDELLCKGGLAGKGDSPDAQWLLRHRLIVCEEGLWRAVMPGLARVQLEMNGLAQPVVEQAPKPPAPPMERGRTEAVHRHQREFFTDEGYRDSRDRL